MTAHPATRLQHSPDVLTEVLDGEALLLHLPDRALHRLNPAATAVWLGLAAEPTSLGALAASLALDFGAPVDAVLADVLAVTTNLLESRLLVVV